LPRQFCRADITDNPDVNRILRFSEGCGFAVSALVGKNPPGKGSGRQIGSRPNEGTHLRRDTVIPQWFQASKATATSDGHAVHC